MELGNFFEKLSHALPLILKEEHKPDENSVRSSLLLCMWQNNSLGSVLLL
jgi:hypothetical protein